MNFLNYKTQNKSLLRSNLNSRMMQDEGVAIVTQHHDFSTAREIPWNLKQLGLEYLLLRTIQTVGVHTCIGKNYKEQDKLWKKVNDSFFSHSKIVEYKLSHLKLEPDPANPKDRKCYRKLYDKYNRLLLEAKSFVDQDKTIIMEGHERYLVFKEIEEIEKAISASSTELNKLDQEATERIKKAQKVENKKKKESLDQFSDNIQSYNEKSLKIQKITNVTNDISSELIGTIVKSPNPALNTDGNSSSSTSSSMLFKDSYLLNFMKEISAAPMMTSSISAVYVKKQAADLEKDLLKYCEDIKYDLTTFLLTNNIEDVETKELLKDLTLPGIISLYCSSEQQKQFKETMTEIGVKVVVSLRIWPNLNKLKECMINKVGLEQPFVITATS